MHAKSLASAQIATLLVHSVALILDMTKSLWYVTLIAKSFSDLHLSSLLPQLDVDLTAIRDAYRASVDWVSGWGAALVVVYDWCVSVMSVLSVDYLFEFWSAWECNGVKSMLSWLAMVLIVLAIHTVNRTDLLFKIALKWGKERRLNSTLEILDAGAREFAVATVLFAIQFLALGMYVIMLASVKDHFGEAAIHATADGPCGAADYWLWQISLYLILLSALFIALWYAMSFSGKDYSMLQILVMILFAPFALLLLPFQCTGCKKWKKAKGLASKDVFSTLLASLTRIGLLTFGVWTADMEQSFCIELKARHFNPKGNPQLSTDTTVTTTKAGRKRRKPVSIAAPDLHSFHEDNKHSEIVSITARERGALWVFFPGCVLLAKASEMLNDPVVLLTPGARAAIRLEAPVWQRVVSWACNVVRIVMTTLIVFRPNVLYVVILLGVMLPPYALNMAVAMYRNKVKAKAENTDSNAAVQPFDAANAPNATRASHPALPSVTAMATPQSTKRPAPIALAPPLAPGTTPIASARYIVSVAHTGHSSNGSVGSVTLLTTPARRSPSPQPPSPSPLPGVPDANGFTSLGQPHRTPPVAHRSLASTSASQQRPAAQPQQQQSLFFLVRSNHNAAARF